VYLKSTNFYHCPADKPDASWAPRFAIPSYAWLTTSTGAPQSGSNQWNRGIGLKLSSFRAQSILIVEPDNPGLPQLEFANDPSEDERKAHGAGAIVGCYGGSAEYMSYAVYKADQRVGLIDLLKGNLQNTTSRLFWTP
jgi:hypothetical protein